MRQIGGDGNRSLIAGEAAMNGDDRRLLDGLRTGRSDAYTELVHNHYRMVYRFLLHMARDVHWAEDLTQETFTIAWERIATFRARSTLATWLHRIAYTRFIDGQRSERRRAALSGRMTRSEIAAADPLDAAMAVDDARRLYKALDELDPAARTVVVLHYLQGLSYREMAIVLDEPSGTVKWRTSDALNSLRILLDSENSDHGSSKTNRVGSVSPIAGSAPPRPATAARSE